MTVIAFKDGHMYADTMSCVYDQGADHRSGHHSISVQKIQPVPDGTPAYVNGDDKPITPDLFMFAGSLRAVKTVMSNREGLLSFFGLNEFKPGRYKIGVLGFKPNDYSYTLIYRIGKKCFSVEFDGDTLVISEPMSEYYAGSGAEHLSQIYRNLFSHRKEDAEDDWKRVRAAMRLLIKSGVSEGVGGDLTEAIADDDLIDCCRISFSDDEKEILSEYYRNSLMYLAGIEKTKVEETPKVEMKGKKKKAAKSKAKEK